MWFTSTFIFFESIYFQNNYHIKKKYVVECRASTDGEPTSHAAEQPLTLLITIFTLPVGGSSGGMAAIIAARESHAVNLQFLKLFHIRIALRTYMLKLLTDIN